MYETQGIRLSDYAESMLKLSLEEFKSTYTKPFLLVEKAEDRFVEDIDTVSPADAPGSCKTNPSLSKPVKIDEQCVYYIEKPDGSLLTRMISVGRQSNNDIVIPSNAISKFHAFFKYDPAHMTYSITDAGSKNGTSLGKQELKPYQPEPIRSKQTLVFGKSIRAIFLLPEDFHWYVNIQKKIYQTP